MNLRDDTNLYVFYFSIDCETH